MIFSKKFVVAATMTAMLSVGATSAFAAIDGFVTEKDGVKTVFDAATLRQDFINSKLGLPAPLYDAFKNAGSVVALSDDQNGYIAYQDVLDAFIAAKLADQSFDANQYTESPAAEKANIDESTLTKTTVDENGQVVTNPVTPPAQDTEAPVITLVGDATMTIKAGDAFTDPGTTVTDNVDTGLVATVTGTVDVYTPGTYTLTYNVSDAAGNAAAEVTRTVVVEEVALAVESVSAINATQISVTFDNGQTVTVDLETPLVDGENQVTFTYEGKEYTATVNYEALDTEAPVLVYDGETTINLEYGAEFTAPVVTATDNKDAEVTVTSVITNAAGEAIEAIDTTVAGTYTITYSAVDAAGNAATNLEITVVVAADAAAPAEPVVAGVAEGDLTNLDVTPTATAVDGVTFTAELTKDSQVVEGYVLGDTITGDGVYVLTVTATKDANQLTSQKVINFTIDATAPTLTVNDAQGAAVADSVKLTGALTTFDFSVVAEEGATVEVTGATQAEGVYTVTAPGNVTVTVTDVAGNVATKNFTVELADAVATTVEVAAISVEENKVSESPVVTVKDQFGNEIASDAYTLSYALAAEDAAIATVDPATGKVTAKGLGEDATATLTVTATPVAGGDAISATAVVTVTEDTTVPFINQVKVIDSTTITVEFNESVAIDNTANGNIMLKYVADDTQSQKTLTSDGATITYEGNIATIKLGQELLNGDYYFVVKAGEVTDLAGLSMGYTSKAFSSSGLTDSKPRLAAASYNNYDGKLTLTFSEAIDNADAKVDETKIVVTGANGNSYTLVDGDYIDDIAKDNVIVTNNISSKLTELTQPFTVTLGADAVEDVTGNKNLADATGKVSTHVNAPVLQSAVVDEKAQTITLTFDKAVKAMATDIDAVGVTLKLTGAVTEGVEATYASGTAFDLLAKATNADGTVQVFDIIKTSGGKADFIANTDITAAKISVAKDIATDATVSDLKNNAQADVAVTYNDDITTPKFTATYNSLTKQLTVTFDEEVTGLTTGAEATFNDDDNDQLANVKFSADPATAFGSATDLVDGPSATEEIKYDDTNKPVYVFTFEDPADTFDNPAGDVYLILNDQVKDVTGNTVAEADRVAKVNFTDLIPPVADTVNVNDNTHMTIAFNEKVDKATAENVNNYTIYAKLNPAQSLAVTKATLLSDQKTVVLTTASQLSITYVVNISNVKDIAPAGNVIVPNVDNKSKFEKEGIATQATAVELSDASFVDEDNSGTVTAGDKITLTFDQELADGSYSATDLALFENNGDAADDENFGTGATVVKSANDAAKLVVTLGTGVDITPDTTKIDVSATTSIKDVTGASVGQNKVVIDNDSKTAAAIESVVFTDVNGDGAAGIGDTLAVTFDKPIDVKYHEDDNTDVKKATALAATFLYNNGDDTVNDALPAGSTAVAGQDGKSVTITFGGDFTLAWTGANASKLAYDKDGAATSGDAQIANKWGTDSDNTAVALAGADEVGPQIESVSYYDTSASGVAGDTIIIDFDQPISVGTVKESDFALTNLDFDNTGADQAVGTTSVNLDKLIITLGGNAEITPGAKINIAEAAANITDVYGNVATPSTAAHDIAVSSDTVRPYLVSATLADTDNDGVISATDVITFTFSEAVAPAADADTVFDLTNQLGNVILSADKKSFTTVVDDATDLDFTYSWNPVNDKLVDLAGNADNTVFTVKIADKYAPTPVANATDGFVTVAGAGDTTIDVSAGSNSPALAEAITLEYKVSADKPAADAVADDSALVAIDASGVIFDEVEVGADKIWLRAIDAAGNISDWIDFGGDK